MTLREVNDTFNLLKLKGLVSLLLFTKLTKSSTLSSWSTTIIILKIFSKENTDKFLFLRVPCRLYSIFDSIDQNSTYLNPL